MRGLRNRALRNAGLGTLAMGVFLAIAPCRGEAQAQELGQLREVADQALSRWPAGRFTSEADWHWNYQLGLLLEGTTAMARATGDAKYAAYTRSALDHFVRPDGSIATYEPKAKSLDDILLGRELLLLYKQTNDVRYRKAAELIREQLRQQPRNPSGGFWHTNSFPDQMLLDDEYMVCPFYAEYARMFHEPQDFPDIVKQFTALGEHTYDPASGLFYQEWNETRKEAWVNHSTGTSASFWARGMGWYVMALVDTLPSFPEHDPGRAALLRLLQQASAGIVRHQDASSGLWFQVLDRPEAKGNYLESSAAGMFVYALAKGVRLGYLPKSYGKNAEAGWRGLQQKLTRREADGSLSVIHTVKGIDLGSEPTHDGSFSYYTNALVVDNDPKGVGAFLLAGTEIAALAKQRRSH